MKHRIALGTAVLALLLTAGLNVQAQAPAAKPGEVTVIGCLQQEADFRRITNSGRGGTLGTGVGQGNEYVLSNAMAPDAAPIRANARRANGQMPAAGAAGKHYMLSGKLEANMLRDVGRMVEVVGMVENGKSATDLARLTITVWHPVGDYCPATK